MDFLKSGLLAVLLMALPGCKTTGGGVPDWVTNPKSAYPENRYLVALGEGDTRRAAENMADAHLARIFESHIKSDEHLVDQSRETQNTFERNTDFTTDINILSSQTLFNIQHAEAWQDGRGRIHAVAYLDRRETASIYRDKIHEQTALVNFLQAQTEQTHDQLKKYATLRSALRHANANQLLLQQLKVIHPPSIPDTTPSYSISKLRKAFADTARKISVEITLTGDTSQRLQSVLEELVTHYGFVIGSPATLTITGKVSVSDTGQRTADLVFVRYALLLQIKGQNGDTLISLSEKGREGHVSLSEARVRSFRTLENTIRPKVKQRLDTYFDSLIDPASK